MFFDNRLFFDDELIKFLKYKNSAITTEIEYPTLDYTFFKRIEPKPIQAVRPPLFATTVKPPDGTVLSDGNLNEREREILALRYRFVPKTDVPRAAMHQPSPPIPLTPQTLLIPGLKVIDLLLHRPIVIDLLGK
jgi:hypothetical protein